MKKLICLLLALLMCFAVLTACDDEKAEDSTGAAHVAPLSSEIDMSTIKNIDGITVTDEVGDYVMIDVEGYGKMVVRLYPDVAPESVANFKKLVSEKFYDGLIFHRVIKNFMIQGGDPEGTGMGGSDQTIKGEFASNGFTNNLKHVRGVVAMARSNNPNSASSQFYICHKTSGVESLDGNYATFGYVIYGLEVIDKIANVKTNANDKPLEDVVINSIRFVKLNDSNSVENENQTNKIDMTPVENLNGVTTSEVATDYVLIDVKDHGRMLVRLYPDVAPETVANFKKLVSEGFYDGLIFHRVIKDFMIQGGADASKTPDTVKGEFAANGFENELEHVRGVISMARTDDPNSASSQFFICHADSPHLDGSYAAFGYVVYGLNVMTLLQTLKRTTTISLRPTWSSIR